MAKIAFEQESTDWGGELASLGRRLGGEGRRSKCSYFIVQLWNGALYGRKPAAAHFGFHRPSDEVCTLLALDCWVYSRGSCLPEKYTSNQSNPRLNTSTTRWNGRPARAASTTMLGACESCTPMHSVVKLMCSSEIKPQLNLVRITGFI